MEARPGAAAPERYWRLNLVLICLGALIGAFAASCITVPLQQVASDLHTSTGLASASVIVYLLVLSGLFLFRIIEAVGATMGAAVITPFVTCHVPEAWHGRGFAYLSGAAVLGVVLGPGLYPEVRHLLQWRNQKP